MEWNDIQPFIERLNQATGLKFRLPTDAEWEYAARGGNRSQGHIYPGFDISILAAWCYNNAGTYILNENKWDYWELRNNGNSPHYVKQLLPNELGLYDMGGNLYEYCSDWRAIIPRNLKQIHKVRKAGLCALYGADVGLFGPIPHAYHTGLHNLTIRIM
mgnify:FL=1